MSALKVHKDHRASKVLKATQARRAKWDRWDRREFKALKEKLDLKAHREMLAHRGSRVRSDPKALKVMSAQPVHRAKRVTRATQEQEALSPITAPFTIRRFRRALEQTKST